MATKKPKKALLSFANDEELGEEIEEFTMKKSKLSNNDTTNSAVNTTKKIKKMKQAPNALSITQQEATVTSSYLSSTGQYDYANLESLRNAQKFSAPVILTEEETNSAANLAQTLTNTAANSNSASNSIYENSKEGNDDTNGLVKKKKLVHFSNEDATINGNDTAVRTAETYESIELSGDAAEQFMELTEQLNKNKNGNSDGNIFFDDGETSMEIVDELALHSAKLATKKMLRDQASNRIYTTAVKEEKKELVFAEEDEGQDWEEELIARGVLQGTLPRASKLETVTSSANISSKSSSTQKGANDDGVTIAEMIDTIRNALGRLQFNLDNAARRKEQLQSQIDESKNHQSELRVKVQVGVEKLNHIQVRDCVLGCRI